MNNFEKHFYLSRGNWYDIFYDLLKNIPGSERNKFEVWEPVDKSKPYVVIIAYASPLIEEYCINNKIWKTHERVFKTFYMPKLNEYNIHSNTNSASGINDAAGFSLVAL